jgi:hypothetical protein
MRTIATPLWVRARVRVSVRVRGTAWGWEDVCITSAASGRCSQRHEGRGLAAGEGEAVLRLLAVMDSILGLNPATRVSLRCALLCALCPRPRLMQAATLPCGAAYAFCFGAAA